MSDAQPRAPLIITVAPNGARKTKQDHPALPITPDELAETAVDCVAAGAAMIHLHVREEDGSHSLSPARYRPAIEAIRSRLGDNILIQVTTEAAGRYQPAAQMAAIRDVKPEAVSIALREIMPEGGDAEAGRAFLADLHAAGTLVQYILYSADDLRRFDGLRQAGAIPQVRPSLLYVLGRYSADMTSAPSDLLPFLAAASECSAADGERLHTPIWALCAFGPLEAACGLTAAGLGGHVRVGFENNMRLADGRIAPDNAALVRQVAQAAGMMGRQLADAAEARVLMTGADDGVLMTGC